MLAKLATILNLILLCNQSQVLIVITNKLNNKKF